MVRVLNTTYYEVTIKTLNDNLNVKMSEDKLHISNIYLGVFYLQGLSYFIDYYRKP